MKKLIMNENKLLVICGPTATGKTALGIKLTKKFGGEIVSADSRQVYRGIDIGTGKDIENFKFQISNFKSISNDQFQIGFYEKDKIRVWLLDVVKPDYRFSVADYVKCANSVIDDILERGKLPILVGGTGFYIKGVADGIETLGVPPDWDLRKQLSELPVEQLREILERIYPERSRRMNESDKHNPRRLIRAIELSMTSPQIFQLPQIPKDILFVGLKAPYKILYQRIDQRVEERVKQGMEEEIKKLLASGYLWGNSVLGTTIGYREWQSYLEHGTRNIEHKPLKNEIIQKWKFAEHGFARRQLTWFKKNKRINWFDITAQNYEAEIEKLIDKWYNE